MNAPLLALLPLLLAGLPLRSDRVDAAVEGVQPAVVKVFGAKGFRGIYGYMTGVIVHESGLVLTRGSVTLDEAPLIRCHLHDGQRLAAAIGREDRRTRMVLRRLIAPEGATFPVAKLGDSDRVRPGQFVLLVGNAYQVSAGKERCAVNFGVVGAVTTLAMRSGLADFPYDGPVILHDAMNNPGVYGGPLVDLRGEVIGISGTIVESKETNAQVHYAIPVNDLKGFVEDTVARPAAPRVYDPGRTAPEEAAPKGPGYHGIKVLRGGVNVATPAYVDRVMKDSPAERAELRPDDLILKVDESRVKTWKSFERLMEGYRAGETVKLTVQRGKEIRVVVLELAEEPR
jgi:S1-C subfamily serine protease